MITTQTHIPLPHDPMILQKIMQLASEYSLNYTQEDDTLLLYLEEGTISFKQQPDSLYAQITAKDTPAITHIKSSLADSLTYFYPDMPLLYHWSGPKTPSKPLSNFQVLTVLNYTDISTQMRRIRFKADNLKAYDSPHFHVRLLFPPDPSAKDLLAPDMIWPVLDENGRFSQTECKHHFEVRVYTIRHLYPDSSEFEIDFFLHDTYGPGASFAKNVRPGQCLGMAGPGGAAFKTAEYYFLSADETGYPALARFCETLPETSLGEVHISHMAADTPYPIHLPKGMQITYHDRTQSQDLVEPHNVFLKTSEMLDTENSVFIWHASDHLQAKKIRTLLQECQKLTKQDYQISGYWRVISSDRI